MDDQANRPHRKTKEKKRHTGGVLPIIPNLSAMILSPSTGPNPKAFGYANPGRLAKQAVRSHDVCEHDFGLLYASSYRID